jgi:DNA-binding IclR family transcriptional regulator
MTEDILAKLDEAIKATAGGKSGADGFTTAEYAASAGVSDATARRRVKLLIAHGRVKYAGDRYEPTMTGVEKPVPVYRVTA